MPYVMNCLAEDKLVQARGNWFTFKPKQLKQMEPHLAAFLGREKRYPGLVCLSDAFEDPDYKNTPEGKAELANAEAEGIADFVEHLRQRVYNNQVSLRMDLETKNMKVDPLILASPGEKEAMELLSKYQKQKDDRDQIEVNRLKELMKTIGPVK